MRHLPGREEVSEFEAAFVNHLLTVGIAAHRGDTGWSYPILANYYRESLADFKAGAEWARANPELSMVTVTRHYKWVDEEVRDNSWEALRSWSVS